MKIVICGGGAVGAACAWFLSRRGADVVVVVVVERAGVACAASGKSGGFLALDWCDGSPLEPLVRRSFALHEALHRDLAGDWRYRAMTTHSGVLGAHRRGASLLPWVSDQVVLQDEIGSPGTTAQVHSARFTDGLMRSAQARGARLVIAEATGLARDRAGTVRGVIVDDETIAADRIVLAMGPWSIRAAGWVDLPAIHALKGHSLVFAAPDLPAEALFLEHRDAEGRAASPEIFPRADGTVYACAISSESPLPDDPAEGRCQYVLRCPAAVGSGGRKVAPPRRRPPLTPIKAAAVRGRHLDHTNQGSA